MKYILTIFILSLLVCSVSATVRYLAPVGTSVSGDWVGHLTTVAGLNAVMVVGDTARMAPGTYKGTPLVPPTHESEMAPWTGAGACDTCTTTYYVCSTWVSEEDIGEESNWNTAIITGADTVDVWDNPSGNIWKASWDGGVLGNDHDSIACVTWGSTDSLLKPALTNVVTEGESFYDNIDDSLYVYLNGGGDPNDFIIYASRQTSLRMNGARHSDYMYFAGIDFRIGQTATVDFSFLTNNAMFQHCNLSRMSWTSLSGNGGVVASTETSGATWGGYISFIGCDISWSKDTRTGSFSHGDGAGFSIYSQHHWLWDSCVIHNTQSSGIYLKESFPTNDIPVIRDTGTTIRYTTFRDIGSMGIEFYRKSYRDSVYGCIFDGVNTDPSHDGGTATAIGVNICCASPQDNDGEIFIANNTFYNCGTTFKTTRDDALGGHIFKYNVSYDRDGVGDWMFFFELSQADFDIDSNIWHDPDIVFSVDTNVTDLNFTQWQAAGQDANSDTTDPGLNDPANGDYSRPNAPPEMNVTYGGRTWTIFGAVQNDGIVLRDGLVIRDGITIR